MVPNQCGHQHQSGRGSGGPKVAESPTPTWRASRRSQSGEGPCTQVVGPLWSPNWGRLSPQRGGGLGGPKPWEARPHALQKAEDSVVLKSWRPACLYLVRTAIKRPFEWGAKHVRIWVHKRMILVGNDYCHTVGMVATNLKILKEIKSRCLRKKMAPF